MSDPIEFHAFVDGELSTSQVAEMEALIESSPIASREIQAIRQLKEFVWTKSSQVDAKDEWKSCVLRLNEIDKARRVEFVVGRFAPALCGIFFLVIVAGGLVSRRHDSNYASPLHPNLARFYGGLNAPKSPVDGNKEIWLKNLINQSWLSTPDHPQFRGGFSYEMDGVPVRRVQVRDGAGDVTVLFIQRHIEFEGMTPMDTHPGFMAGRVNNMNCVARSENVNTVAVIADRPYEDLVSVLSH